MEKTEKTEKTKISASELYTIATEVSNTKIKNMFNEYYDKIINAAKEGKFEITISFQGDMYSQFSTEDYIVIDKLEEHFPGIYIQRSKEDLSCEFSWYSDMIYLNIPTSDKNTVRSLGAKFDRDSQRWYIYDGNIHKEILIAKYGIAKNEKA